MRITIALVLITLAAACSSAPAKPDSETMDDVAEKAVEEEVAAPESTLPTTYWTGSVITSSADGSKMFGAPKEGLVKRELDRANGTIIETVWDETKFRVVKLTQQGDTNVFDATDDEGTFTGTMEFSPNAWEATSWMYALEMADGSAKIEGKATVTPETIVTEKYIVGPDGERIAKVVDNLVSATQSTFEERARGAQIIARGAK